MDPDVAPTRRTYLTPTVARTILKARRGKQDKVTCSLDLNRSRAVVRFERRKVLLPDGTELPVKELQKLSRRRERVFVVSDGEIQPVERRGQFYYKLMATDSAPTLEISGIKMHRTEGCCPYAQAEEIVRTVVQPGDRVLDTCGGLGYTAIWAARLGAERVVSVEYDINVLEIARLNPWSEEYLFDSRIDVMAEDVTDLLRSQPAGSFEAAVHDPPHISRAGDLYGRDFYFELSRVLTVSGRMYHYVGEPHSKGKKKQDIQGGVAERLESVGFITEYAPELQGFVCRKRR
ncbi:MAG: SAM-dependent methyltransferase [Planctomycetota bacterium]